MFLVVVVIVTAWFALLRPTGLGGPATFIIVSGNSMEPTYSDGDLVVLHKASEYTSGDIVAYPMMTHFDTGRLVIHRVVGHDAEGIITQGDNRETEDPWRPTNEDIRGAAWLHIPKLGSYMAWLQQPNHLGGLAAGIILMGGIGGAAETTRKRRNGMNRHPRKLGAPAGPGIFGSNQPALVGGLAIAGLAAALFLLLAVVAYAVETHRVTAETVPTYSETGSFEYEITMEPSTLSPDGVLRPTPGAESQPSAFTNLARSAAVMYRYELQPGTSAANLTGTIAADLVIRTERGEWSRSAVLLAPKDFVGLTVEETVVIDLRSTADLIAQIAKETGLSSSAYEVVVQMTVNGSGTWAGEPIEVAFEQPFSLRYNQVLITPPATLTSTVESSRIVTQVATRHLSFIPGKPSVTTARTVGTVGFSATLGAALVLAGYLLLTLARDEEARIRARYGSRIVEVQPTNRTTAKDSIRVASMRDLLRLAERFSTVVLHQQTRTGHRYFVRDGEDTYEYVSSSAASSQGVSKAPELPHAPGGDS